MTRRPWNAARSSYASVCITLGLAFALAVSSLSVAPPASAQETDQPPTLVKHLRSELQSKDAGRLNAALVDVVMLARCTEECTVPLASVRDKEIRITEESGTKGLIDLDALTPELIEVYRTGPADGIRLMALSALVSIGNQQALEQVIEVSPTQPQNVKRATDQTLAAFYLEKYPELMERTQRTKNLRIVDLQRAERMRVKAERTGTSE